MIVNFNDFDVDETYDDSPLTNKKFVKFLKDNNLHDKFINNLKQLTAINTSVETFCDDVNEYDYISLAFVWDYTDEGIEFWDKINTRWKEYIGML